MLLEPQAQATEQITPASADAGQQNTAASAQVPTPASAASSGAAASSTLGAGGAGVPGSAAAAAAQADAQSVRDALASYGLDLRNQFQDDHQALQHLVMLARQAASQQPLVQYGQQYLQHASDFQRYLEERQRQQQQSQQQQSWWKAPEYDPTWARRLMRDPQTGEIKPMPGEPLDLVQKYQAWAEHQRSFLDKFAQDPIGAIKPGLEQVVQQVAQQMVQQQLASYQERQQAESFLAQNADWMFARDGQGQPLVNPATNQPALSPLGQQFAAYVFEAERMGLRDTASQQRYAMNSLQRDYLAARYQQQAGGQAPPAPPPGEAAKQQFLQAAQAGARTAPAAPPGNTNGEYRQPNGVSQRGLQELLLQEMKAAGFQPGQPVV